MHTVNSDGTETPTVMMETFRDRGYDFASITDHDLVTADAGVAGILFVPSGIEETPNVPPWSDHITRTVALGHAVGNPQAILNQVIVEGSYNTICHPNYGAPDWTLPMLASLTNYHGDEVWNQALAAALRNAETQVDYLLGLGRRFHLIAVDDAHGAGVGSAGLSSVYVFADALNWANIQAEMFAGNFYASNGALITSITLTGKVLTIVTPAASNIQFIGASGVLQTTLNSLAASYTIIGHERYVRANITRVSDAKMAWSNPVYVDWL
jgi:hypothetical protein